MVIFIENLQLLMWRVSKSNNYVVPNIMYTYYIIPTYIYEYVFFLLLMSPIFVNFVIKVEKNLKGSLDSIPSPSLSVKIQIMGGKFCLRCKGKTLLGVVTKLLNTKSLLTSPSNVLAYSLKETFPPIIWIFMKVKVMGSDPGYLLQSFLP